MRATRHYLHASLAATTLVVAACSSSDKRPQPPPAANAAPVVAAIADQSVNQDTTVGPITFAISDAETPADQLTVVATANDGTIFSPDGIVVGGSGANRTLTLTPLEEKSGTATIGVFVSDAGGVSTTRFFTVAVNARAASFRAATFDTYAKAEDGDPTPVNGFTFTQDAEDSASFDEIVPPEQP